VSLRTAFAFRARLRAWPIGGLLVVSGPPLEGKALLLAAYLDDLLPNAVKLETLDSLALDDQTVGAIFRRAICRVSCSKSSMMQGGGGADHWVTWTSIRSAAHGGYDLASASCAASAEGSLVGSLQAPRSHT